MLYPIRYICNVYNGGPGKKGYGLKLPGGLELNPWEPLNEFSRNQRCWLRPGYGSLATSGSIRVDM